MHFAAFGFQLECVKVWKTTLSALSASGNGTSAGEGGSALFQTRSHPKSIFLCDSHFQNPALKAAQGGGTVLYHPTPCHGSYTTPPLGWCKTHAQRAITQKKTTGVSRSQIRANCWHFKSFSTRMLYHEQRRFDGIHRPL